MRRLKRAGRGVLDAGAKAWSGTWRPYSRLIPLTDSPIWVLSEEMREITSLARRLGVKIAHPRWQGLSRRQALFFASHFMLLLGRDWPDPGHRVATAYFHGKPGTGVPEFDQAYARLRREHERVHRVQASHSEMRDLILETGLTPDRVFLIPIGLNPDYFTWQTPESRRQARQELGLPQTAVVVGSFQKDGSGWGEGMEPKLIKGPDVFLQVMARLKPRIPELFALLSGPARGYVKAGLERLGIPYQHYYFRAYAEVWRLYQALDLYLVASRQEGGPKAVLESMASGAPLVTTRVGQAMDLVEHGVNAWMAESEDVDGLAHWAEYAVSHPHGIAEILAQGRATAQANTYAAQLPLWREFFRGFIDTVV